MDTLQRLQAWYSRQCNGDWEHTYGVTVGTIDNPGWSLKIDLTGTDLQGRAFESAVRGVEEESENWIHCKVEAHQFVGFRGPAHLGEIMEVFLRWAEL